MEYIDNLPSMDLMRSEKMTFAQLIIPVESAHRAVSYLGELGLLQFRDLNDDKSPFQRTFVNQVKRCAEMSRKLRFFKDQIHKAGLMPSPHPASQPDIDLEELEIRLAEHEHELIEMNTNSEKLQQTYNELLEFKMVLQKAGDFLVPSGSHSAAQETELDENVYTNNDYADSASLLEQEMQPGSSNESGVKFISGIICKSKGLRFERMLFRTTRGNMLFNQAPADDQIVDPASNEMVEKTVFVVLSRLSELETTLEAGLRHRDTALTSIGFQLTKWMNMVRREKAIYDTLNMLNFDVTKKCLVGEGWCPIFAKTKIQEALQRATFDSNSQVGIIFHVMDSVELPPTYFRTNHFTNAYQEIVDAYGHPVGPLYLNLKGKMTTCYSGRWFGDCYQTIDYPKNLLLHLLLKPVSEVIGAPVAKYQEANPAVYTIVTFPFLFAVMFGDWGHGICLLLGALFLIAREKRLGSQKLGSFMEMLFGGRYVLLMMSLFSIYCGLIYNEFFSVPFHIFGSSAYKCRDATCSDARSVGLIKDRDTYPFGVDPSWRGSRSELPFLNSLKMKMSILFGVAQMNLGILLSYFNARYFSNSLDIRFQGRTYGILGTSDMYNDEEPDSARQSHNEDFNFSEVFVHQMIHSIEFVLGAVSNTASYLRLWALSLAHSELSTVFYEKVLLLAWGYDNFIIRLVGLAVFAFATAFILLMMETLSAFLHALRLHWVEFQNKFYSGDGYKFRPFSFAALTDDDE
ncbi:hypothetical protein DH2020_021297 [Rehmannia glutinosa]|uniref:V-type proton ATPase subunit a n=1 Tax=Rehmannia glutinosa TaxID=99300 RepID=A0ABR0WDV7_REHGL